jgi:predicted Fe-S protein YdhL (DUF1289 family)
VKPCAKNREPIVWLAVKDLDARQTRELQAHLETCEGCRRYLAEILNVTEWLAVTEANSGVQASAIFHQKLAGRLRTAKPAAFVENLAANFRETRLRWRVALATLAALVVIDVTVAITRRPPHVSLSPQAVAQTAPASGADIDLAPTMANYQKAADESLDKLDALLTRQGNRALPSMPIYTDSTLALADESF